MKRILGALLACLAGGAMTAPALGHGYVGERFFPPTPFVFVRPMSVSRPMLMIASCGSFCQSSYFTLTPILSQPYWSFWPAVWLRK